MVFFDKYSSKVKEEKRRFKESHYIEQEIPDFYFSKKILKIFPDIDQRDDVYFYLNKTTPEIYEKFLKLAENNKQMALQLVNNKITLSEQLFKNIDKLSYPFYSDILDENVINKLLQFKNNHSSEVYYKLCDYYVKNPKEQLLDIANEIKNNDFWNLNINELYNIYSIKNNEKQNKLIYFINNKNVNYYLVYKNVVKEYDEEIDYVVKVLEDNKFSPEYIETYLSSATNKESLAYAIKYKLTDYLTKDNLQKYYEYIDIKFEEVIQGKLNPSLNVEELKKEMVFKFTGLSSFKYHNLLGLYKKFNYTTSQDFKVLFELLNKIEMCKDMNELIHILNNCQQTISREQFLDRINNLKIVEHAYNDILYKDLRTGNDIEYKEYNGKQIEYIKFNGTEFNILCHRINAARHADGLPNRNIVDELLVNPANFIDDQISGSDYLACSLIYEGNLNTFSNGTPGDVLLAFSDLNKNRIIGTFCSDHGSNMRGVGQDQSKGNVITDLYTLDELKSPTFNGTYNEVTISRKEDGVKKKPDYMVVIKHGANNQNVDCNENCLRYAAYYNIPILEIDVQRLNYNIDKKNREKKGQLEELKRTLIEQNSHNAEQTLENSRTI